ncbi:MAG: SH3 domain-containing protein [Niameybacter sp.]
MKTTTIKFLLCTAVVTMMTTNTFANVIGVVQSAGGVGYNKEQKYTVELNKGTQLQIVDLQEGKDAYLINAQGQTVTVNKDYLSISKILTETTVGGVKVRKLPSAKSTLLKTLDSNQVVNVLGQNEKWYNVVLEDGTEGFIYKSQLSDERLNMIQSKVYEAQKIEVLNWSNAKSVVTRGAIVTIEDVYTGKTFKVKRTFGTNHADVEALTLEDTKIIKNIWGGFSWERRPVIVHINGRMLAAALAGMPHAGSSLNAVKNNGMSGVLDLHFIGSKRHQEGNIAAVVDPQHQAAIKVAAKYKK